MNKINFKNLPDTTTPLSAENLNLLQDNVEDAIPTLDSTVSTSSTNGVENQAITNYVNSKTTSTGWQQVGANSYDTKYNKTGNVVSIQCYSPSNATITGYSQTVVGVLPSALKPAMNIRSGVYARGNSNVYVQINSTNGNIVIFNWGSEISYTDGGMLAFCLTFII